MSYDTWLEKPYEDEAELSERDEWAQANGYDSFEDYIECLKDEKADRDLEERWEREHGFDDREIDDYGDY